MTHPRCTVIWSAGLLALTLSGTTDPRAAADGLTSRWRTTDVRVDGVNTEWPTLTSLSKEVAAAAVNDADVLYLALSASDQGVRARLLATGLIVYIDPTNKKKESFGIRLPPLGRRPVPDEPPPAPGITYFEVLGPGKSDARIVEIGEQKALEVGVGEQQGSLVLEFRIPLRPGEGQPLAPNVGAGQSLLGLGLLTPDAPRSGGLRGGGPPIGVPGGMPPGGMRPGGMGGGQDPRSSKSIEVWTTLQLARGPA